MELIRELNYTCNADTFHIIFAIKTAFPNKEERNRVIHWLYKILKNDKTLGDLKIRNEFLQYLKENVQNGKLEYPFNQDPAKTPLKALVRHLPEYEERLDQDDEETAMLRFLPAKNGGFLLPKPLPAVGAYIHIAANCFPNSQNCTED